MKVGFAEVEPTGEAMRHGHAVQAGPLGRAYPVGRILEGDRLAGGHAKRLERRQIQVWLRLRAKHIFPTSNALPVAAELEPLQVAGHPLARSTRGDRQPEAEPLRIAYVGSHAGQQRLDRDQLEHTAALLQAQRVALQWSAEEALEIVQRIEPASGAADALRPHR